MFYSITPLVFQEFMTLKMCSATEVALSNDFTIAGNISEKIKLMIGYFKTHGSKITCNNETS